MPGWMRIDELMRYMRAFYPNWDEEYAQDLRRQLTDYPFRTKSDTEVILALYQRYGPQALNRLPGMFAFAIWDESRHELFCARDRFGARAVPPRIVR